jgi:D-inositol-3-phosphate glycosyltransferase
VKILAVTHYWHPHRGGIETVALQQARRLARRGHQMSIVTSRLAGDPAFTSLDGVSVHRVRAANWFEASRGIPFPIFSPKLVPLLARLSPEHDVVLVHNHTYLGSVAASFVASAQRRPVVLLQHSPFVDYRFPWKLVEHAADQLLGRPTLRRADAILATTAFTREYVRRLVPERRVDLMPLGVDTQRFTPAESGEYVTAVRQRLGIPENAFVLLSLRRLVFRNGLDTLVEAARLLQRHEDVFVAIAGCGPEHHAIERYIQQHGLDNVRLMGFAADDDLPDLYRAADAFVLPTRTGEGFGLVLLEAFASGIPCIATRGGGQEEVIDHGRTGLLISPGSAAELADAALALERDMDGKTMGIAAREAAVERDWERSVDRLEEALAGAALRSSVQETAGGHAAIPANPPRG